MNERRRKGRSDQENLIGASEEKKEDEERQDWEEMVDKMRKRGRSMSASSSGASTGENGERKKDVREGVEMERRRKAREEMEEEEKNEVAGELKESWTDMEVLGYSAMQYSDVEIDVNAKLTHNQDGM